MIKTFSKFIMNKFQKTEKQVRFEYFDKATCSWKADKRKENIEVDIDFRRCIPLSRSIDSWNDINLLEAKII